MLTSLALIFLVGLCMAAVCQKLKLPRIIGMLVTGMVLGPYVLDFLDSSILSISAELRKMALIIILLKAGLSLNLNDLKKVGRPAILLAFVPASFEIVGYVLFAPAFLGISRIDAAVMGAVLAAVSPAVVVPRMVQLMEEKYGTKQSIPQMIMAGASCDDIFVIVLFTTFLGMAQGAKVSLLRFVNVPVSILLGILLGAVIGYVLYRFFEMAYKHQSYVRNSTKVILVLGVSFLLTAVEGWLDGKVAVSGLLAVVSMACVLKAKCIPAVSKRLSEKFGKLWIAAEVILFVLVGAAVDLRYTAAMRRICCAGNFPFADISYGRCVCLRFGYRSVMERKTVLCHFVFAKSDGSGGDWFGAACCRIRLWKDDFIGGGFGDFNNRTAWRTGDGFDV